MRRAGVCDQAAQTVLLKAAQPFAGLGGLEQASGGLDDDVAGRFDQHQAMIESLSFRGPR